MNKLVERAYRKLKVVSISIYVVAFWINFHAS
jgi:hypothetical protein